MFLDPNFRATIGIASFLCSSLPPSLPLLIHPPHLHLITHWTLPSHSSFHRHNPHSPFLSLQLRLFSTDALVAPASPERNRTTLPSHPNGRRCRLRGFAIGPLLEWYDYACPFCLSLNTLTVSLLKCNRHSLFLITCILAHGPFFFLVLPPPLPFKPTLPTDRHSRGAARSRTFALHRTDS